jgi:hypothetical protein
LIAEQPAFNDQYPSSNSSRMFTAKSFSPSFEPMEASSESVKSLHKMVQSTMIIVRNTSKHILNGMDKARISKRKRCSENLYPLDEGCQPRYMLRRYSLANHTSRSTRKFKNPPNLRREWGPRWVRQVQAPDAVGASEFEPRG